MKTLQEIKDEVARDKKFSDYSDLLRDFYSRDGVYEAIEFMDIVAERYATEKARESVIASLEKAAENARVNTWYSVGHGGEDVVTYKIYKNSITSEENIIIK